MPLQADHIHNDGVSNDSRRLLTPVNLAEHEARSSAEQKDPTPMQRWYINAEDQIVQGRVGHYWKSNVYRDPLATEIERIIQDVSKGKNSKWYVTLPLRYPHMLLG